MTKVNLLTPLCTDTLAVAPLAQAQELTLKTGYGIVEEHPLGTQHGYSPCAVPVGKNFWDKLPTAQQQAMSASCKKAGAGPVRS